MMPLEDEANARALHAIFDVCRLPEEAVAISCEGRGAHESERCLWLLANGGCSLSVPRDGPERLMQVRCRYRRRQ